jgi:hypothetical protein
MFNAEERGIPSRQPRVIQKGIFRKHGGFKSIIIVIIIIIIIIIIITRKEILGLHFFPI